MKLSDNKISKLSPDLQFLASKNFHDCKIIGIIKEKNDLILQIDASGGFLDLDSFKIRFKNYTVVTENILDYKLNVPINNYGMHYMYSKILPDMEQRWIVGGEFNIKSGEFYFTWFFASRTVDSIQTQELCIIKFSEAVFEEKIDGPTLEEQVAKRNEFAAKHGQRLVKVEELVPLTLELIKKLTEDAEKKR